MKRQHFLIFIEIKLTNIIKLQQLFVLTLLFLNLSGVCFAQGLKVAVAANLQGVIKVLQKDFANRTRINIEPIAGSSGNLTTQIKHGAPFDIFLSADMDFPEILYKEGFSLTKPVVYAYGNLIICSTENLGFENWEKLLLSEQVKKIAIANFSIAPYGKAAEELLKQKGVFDTIKAKIIIGESISQVNTYITTGVVNVGFTTRALVKDVAGKTTLYWKEIDPKSYSPIQQGMIIIKQSQQNTNALKFYKYLLSPPAKAILKDYGYGV